MVIIGRWYGWIVKNDVIVLYVEIKLVAGISFIRDIDIDTHCLPHRLAQSPSLI
jgi:hypothetical protein